jgi:four helix bundle protein
MTLAHERLDVYQRAIDFTSWAHQLLESLPPGLSARTQLERASTSIPLNLAESNGKLSEGERARFLQIALGSALECSATLDVLTAKGVLNSSRVEEGKELLERIAAMLMAMLRKLGKTVSQA